MSMEMPVAASPRIIAIANQKGGVGKTTTSVNLAAALAVLNKRVLLIDLDPQGNASGGLGIDRHTSSTIYDVLIGRKELAECIQKTYLPGLDVVSANQNLIGAELELINAISREKKLKSALKKTALAYDFVIFDCAPSLGLLTINALTASHSVLIPTQCEYFAMEGLGQLLSTYQLVKDDLNEDLEIEGVVLTMFDPRNKLTHEVVREMKQHFPEKLFRTQIPRNIKLSEAPSFGKPVLLYDPESKGAQAYFDLGKEVLERNGMPYDQSIQLIASEEVAEPAPTVEEVAPDVVPDMIAEVPPMVVEAAEVPVAAEATEAEVNSPVESVPVEDIQVEIVHAAPNNLTQSVEVGG